MAKPWSAFGSVLVGVFVRWVLGLLWFLGLCLGLGFGLVLGADSWVGSWVGSWV